MDIKAIFKKSIPYISAIVIFLIVSSLYFKPAFDGYDVKQADMVNYRGMSNDLNAYYDATDGEEPLWTNSMFSGMPATQIAVFNHGNHVRDIRSILSLGLPHPVNILFLYFVGFFILGLVLRINPWISVAGALAFGFSSYFIIIIEAGHVTKAYTIAFMAPVIAAFIMAYRRSLMWGIILSAFFMLLQIGSNHVQITYYLGFVLLGIVIYELVKAIRKKTYKRFALATAGILFAYVLAGMSSASNLLGTMEYAKETIRGKNNLTITANLRPNESNSTDGLDRDYVTQWSYGKAESLTLAIPFAKGGHSTLIGNGEFADKLKESDFTRGEKDFISNSLQYWGDQPFTSGPVYVGALVFFLAVLALFFVQSKIKWVLLSVTILTLFMSWGKNWMGFTDLLLDYLPLYSKFRAVTIVLVVVELCLPILAILFLNQLYNEREAIVAQKKKFFAVSGGIAAFMIFLIAFPPVTGLYSQAEIDKQNDPELYIGSEVRQQVARIPKEQLVQYGVQNPNDAQEVEQFMQAVINQQVEAYDANIPALGAFRSSIFSSDATRSFMLMLLGFGMILVLLFMPSVNVWIPMGVIAIAMVGDLINLDIKYLNNEGKERGGEMIYNQWQKVEEKKYPLTPKDADIQILEAEMAANPELKNRVDQVAQEAQRFAKENEYSRIATNNYVQRERFRIYNELTNFRVADVTEAISSSSRASYWHESIGGYHGAKLQRYQNLFEFDYIPYDQQILNMLNTKYIIQNTAQGPMARLNAGAMGNAWFSKDITFASDENQEILKLGKEYTIEPKSGWKLIVNDEQTEKTNVYGREEVVATKDGDSIVVQWPDGLSVSMTAYLVSDTNGKVNWVPSMVIENDTTNSFIQIVKLDVNYNFNPNSTTVVNEDYSDYVQQKSFSGQGKIQLTARDLKSISYETESNEEQLAVFSEIHYPMGWNAYIDGELVEHIRVNYVLRGLKIPAGKHVVEFKVNESTHQKGVTIATIGSWLIYLLLIAGAGYSIYDSRRKVA